MSRTKALQLAPEAHAVRLNYARALLKAGKKAEAKQELETLAKLGDKGLFVKEIEEALLDGRAHLAVHSMKDVPVELPEGLVIGVTPEREVHTDAMCSVRFSSLESLPHGATVGTSSLRRQVQLLSMRPDLDIVSLRGNVDTRMRKLAEGQFDAIVMATAGLKRLGLAAARQCELGPPLFLPAVGQGALGIEYRAEDTGIAAMLAPLNHAPSQVAVAAERGFLQGLEGGCQAPIAAYATVTMGNDIPVEVRLTGMLADVDGSKVIREQIAGPADQAKELGLELAAQVRRAGGKAILDRIYAQG